MIRPHWPIISDLGEFITLLRSHSPVSLTPGFNRAPPVPLAPGFNRVADGRDSPNRFNGFSPTSRCLANPTNRGSALEQQKLNDVHSWLNPTGSRRIRGFSACFLKRSKK